ncbi:MAG: hypothetical protein BIFFINMI_03174 [Phycisphaerae bacterium]|nr:hypothetical protein [Phycisphaerae bacterium]
MLGGGGGLGGHPAIDLPELVVYLGDLHLEAQVVRRAVGQPAVYLDRPAVGRDCLLVTPQPLLDVADSPVGRRGAQPHAGGVGDLVGELVVVGQQFFEHRRRLPRNHRRADDLYADALAGLAGQLQRRGAARGAVAGEDAVQRLQRQVGAGFGAGPLVGFALQGRPRVEVAGRCDARNRDDQQRHRRRQRRLHRVPPRPAPQPPDRTDRPGLDRTVVQEPLKVVAQRVSRRVAVGRVASDGLEDDGLQIARDVGVDASRPRRRLLGDLLDQAAAVALVERRAERQQLVERQPEAVDVAAAVGASGEPLRRRVAQRAGDLPAGRRVGRLDRLGQSEVGHPDHAAGVQQQVGRLDVAVQRALRVGVGQGVGDLSADAGDDPPVARSAGRGGVVADNATADRLQPGGFGVDGRQFGPLAAPGERCDDPVQPRALDVLHDVEVKPLLLADAVDLHDVGVVQPRRDAGLALEALELALVGQRQRGQHLERDAAAERLLLGFVDDAHAAAADLADDAEVAQLLELRRSERGPPVAAALAAGFEPLQRGDGGEQVADLVGKGRVERGVFVDGRAFASPSAGDELLGQRLDRVALCRRVSHSGSARFRCPRRRGLP